LRSLEKAAINTGLATTKDYNLPDAPSCGYFPLETAINSSGERVSAMSAYLNKSIARERIDRLSVCTGTVASRLEITGDEKSGRVVSGVHIRSSAHPSGKDYFVKARREVILTCGAMTTPQLLLLSGIGPNEKESAGSRLDIPLVKELPAVGADMSDHYSVPILLEIPSNETLQIMEVGLWGLWYLLLWIFTGKGMVGRSVTPSAVFLHTDSIDKETMQITRVDKQDVIPNIEIMMIPTNSLERAVPGRSLFSLYPTITQPVAKGTVQVPFRKR
jgi:choline dehydrogenase-like flavoprotein